MENFYFWTYSISFIDINMHKEGINISHYGDLPSPYGSYPFSGILYKTLVIFPFLENQMEILRKGQKIYILMVGPTAYKLKLHRFNF